MCLAHFCRCPVDAGHRAMNRGVVAVEFRCFAGYVSPVVLALSEGEMPPGQPAAGEGARATRSNSARRKRTISGRQLWRQRISATT